VTTKKIIPPGGSKHSYLSYAPYWWPKGTAICMVDSEITAEMKKYLQV
jgi:hypothetical protein